MVCTFWKRVNKLQKKTGLELKVRKQKYCTFKLVNCGVCATNELLWLTKMRALDRSIARSIDRSLGIMQKRYARGLLLNCSPSLLQISLSIGLNEKIMSAWRLAGRKWEQRESLSRWAAQVPTGCGLHMEIWESEVVDVRFAYATVYAHIASEMI